MNEPAVTRGLSAPDLEFLTAHCRDLRLASGEELDHLPHVAACLSDACVTMRVVEGDRLRGLAIAIDCGIERRVFVVTVQFAARGTGLARRLLQGLVRPHLAASPKNRAVAAVWPGVTGGPGLLLSTGFDTAPGLIRFVRKTTTPLAVESPSPTLRWLWIEREPADRLPRLLTLAAAANPTDTDFGPSLAALATHQDAAILVGFAAGRRFVISHLYSAESVRDHGPAEHALSRLAHRAADAGATELLLESSGPVQRAMRTLLRLDFRATEAAAGFISGPPAPHVPGDLFVI